MIRLKWATDKIGKDQSQDCLKKLFYIVVDTISTVYMLCENIP